MRKYNPPRSRNVYDPSSDKPFKISRSKIDRFLECPRCFYLDRRLATDRPPGFPFNINSAVDTLLKREFDGYRVTGTQHPLQIQYNVAVKPAANENLDTWRENFKGVQYLHVPTNLIITGAIDDLWIDDKGQHIVVDYKATAKKLPVKSIDEEWQLGYKRQMEIYQWLLRRNGLAVSDTGYFVYCTGNPAAPSFDGKVDFAVHLIEYNGDDSWVEGAICELHGCLQADSVPEPGADCDYCKYVNAVQIALRQNAQST